MEKEKRTYDNLEHRLFSFGENDYNLIELSLCNNHEIKDDSLKGKHIGFLRIIQEGIEKAKMFVKPSMNKISLNDFNCKLQYLANNEKYRQLLKTPEDCTNYKLLK